MKITGLITLQLSVKETTSGLFKLSYDSGWNFVCNLIAGFQSLYPELNILLICPPEHQIAECTERPTLRIEDLQVANVAWDRVKLCRVYHTPYIFLSRHHFSSSHIINILKGENFSFAWINDPCQLLSWKTALYYLNKERAPLYIAYNNWIDDPYQARIPRSLSFLISQVEGAFHADVALFNSKAAIKQFKRAARTIFADSWLKDIIDPKCFTVSPGFDINLIDSIRNDMSGVVQTMNFSESTTRIMFNHRLNNLDFYKSNWSTSFDLLYTLFKKGYRFEVICTDTSDKILCGHLKTIYPFLRFVEFSNYTEYITALWKSDLALGLFKHSGTWSLSLLEAMATNCATIIPAHSGYLEMVPKNYPGLVDPNKEDAVLALLENLIQDSSFREEVGTIGSRFVRSNFGNQQVLQKIINYIERSFWKYE